MKSKIVIVLFLCFLFMNCKTEEGIKKIKILDKVPANFQMYETSEMAELMRFMYAENTKIRELIIAGNEIDDFNETYLKIHKAKLTDISDLDNTFFTFANFFIENQKKIFKVDKIERKNQFNKTVNACITCHKDRCAGPIPRIKKLIIH